MLGTGGLALTESVCFLEGKSEPAQWQEKKWRPAGVQVCLSGHHTQVLLSRSAPWAAVKLKGCGFQIPSLAPSHLHPGAQVLTCPGSFGTCGGWGRTIASVTSKGSSTRMESWCWPFQLAAWWWNNLKKKKKDFIYLVKSLTEIQLKNLKDFLMFNWLKKQIKSPGKQRFILEESWIIYFDDSQNEGSCSDLKFQNASTTFYLTVKFLLETGGGRIHK